jgi:hypothetical protein
MPESGGKGVFPRTYYPGRLQRFYEGYDAIDWSKKLSVNEQVPVEETTNKTTNQNQES